MKDGRREKRLDILLLTVVLFLIAAIIYREYLFGDKTYIFRDAGSDTFNQYWPVVERFVRKVRHGELSFWLFDMGLGTSVVSILDYVFDPFTFLLLFFPDGTVAYGLVWVAVIKEVTAGILFYLLGREIGLGRISSLIGSVCWAFSGYMVLWGQHYFFATVIPCYTLIMLGVARYRYRGSGKLLVIALFLQAMGSIYFTFWSVLGFLLTVLFCYFLEKQKSWKGFAEYLWGYFWRGLIAAGLSAFRWIPSAMFMLSSFQISDGARNPDLSFFWNKTDYLDFILRGFSNNSLGMSAENVLSYNYYEQIMWSLSILAIVFLFHNLVVRKEGKGIFIIAAMLVVASFLTRIPTLLMNIGKDDKWRWSFLIVFLLSLNLSYAVEDIIEHKRERLFLLILEFAFGVTLLLASFLLLWQQFSEAMSPDDYRLSQLVFGRCIFFLCLFFTMLLSFMCLEKGKLRQVLERGLLGVVCIEVIVLNLPTVGERRLAVPKAGAYTMDYFSPGNMQAIHNIYEEDDGIYRLERVLTCGGNDPFMMAYRGTFLYGMYEKEIGDFYAMNGLQGTEGDYTVRIAGEPVLESLLGVKYMLTGEPIEEDGYVEREKLTVYNKAISQEETVYTNQNQNAFPLLYVVERETAEVIDTMLRGNRGAGELKKILEQVNEIAIEKNKESDIQGTVTMNAGGVLLTSIPYDKGWKLYVDGEVTPVKTVNVGFVGADLGAGTHELRLVFCPKGLILGTIVSLVTFVLLCFGIIRKKKEKDDSI